MKYNNIASAIDVRITYLMSTISDWSIMCKYMPPKMEAKPFTVEYMDIYLLPSGFVIAEHRR
jgi:hypothetical protein